MVKISAAQIGISHGNLEDNTDKICSFMGFAGKGMIIFPELIITGVYRPELAELEYYIGRVQKKAAEIGIWATVGAYATRQGKTFNELYLIDNKGRLAYTYQKKHPWIEEHDIEPGTTNQALKTDFGIIGLLNCYDIRFPEESDNLIRQGAELIVCPSYWFKEYPDYMGYPEKTAARCKVPLVMCDAANSEVVGKSKIISPKGIVLAEARGEQMISYRKI
jgi:predicted amidohydrolase